MRGLGLGALWAASALLHDPNHLSEDAEGALQRLQPLSAEHLGQWAVHVGIALVDLAHCGSLCTAEALAQELDFLGPKLSLLIVLSDMGVELAGSLLDPSRNGSEALLPDFAEWLEVEALCARLGLRGLQAAVDGLLRVLTGSQELPLPKFKQRELHKWTSQYQVGEVWLNLCGDRPCRELVLGDVRQLSEGFERYYHEAMVLPALNLLGASKDRHVLVLGGGDGGIATCALQFPTVKKVVNVDIDATVADASKRWFPAVAAGFNDSRCELVAEDAFAWVKKTKSKFDLVIIDFTDEPLDGAWSEKFFRQVRGLMTSDGIVVQNVGTITTPDELQRLFELHSQVFATVYPIHALIPDYLGPYILVLSSLDQLQPMKVDWDFWHRHHLPTQYYGQDQHAALFAVPADVASLLGLGLDEAEAVQLPLPPLPSSNAGREKVVFRDVSREGNGVKVVKDGSSLSLYQEWDAVLSPYSWHRDECLILPALAILEDPASVLVLGGGTGAIASFALRWPSVSRVVVVEVDELLVQTLRRYFPVQAKVFSDPRTELIMADAFTWILTEARQFDVVVVNMFDQPWLPARRTTRVPPFNSFYRRLRDLLTPRGLLLQEVGSVAMPSAFGAALELHRRNFAQTWPLATSSAAPQAAGEKDDFDGLYFRIPRLLLLSSGDAQLEPRAVASQQWQGFATAGPTTYYYPALHRHLFALPMELQRRFRAYSPWRPLQETSNFLIQSFVTQAHGCSMDALNDVDLAGSLLKKMAHLAELTALGSLEHRFEPQGVTALLLVSESHLSIHTWPELRYAALDVVSCKLISSRVQKAIEMEVENSLRCTSVVSHFSLRGRMKNMPEKASILSMREEL